MKSSKKLIPKFKRGDIVLVDYRKVVDVEDDKVDKARCLEAFSAYGKFSLGRVLHENILEHAGKILYSLDTISKNDELDRLFCDYYIWEGGLTKLDQTFFDQLFGEL